MPNYDGTGPFGDGRPGRGLGPCGRTDYAYGFGCGRRRGLFPRMGGYFRNIYDFVRPIFSDEGRYDENYTRSNLKARKSALENELERINKELSDKGNE